MMPKFQPSTRQAPRAKPRPNGIDKEAALDPIRATIAKILTEIRSQFHHAAAIIAGAPARFEMLNREELGAMDSSLVEIQKYVQDLRVVLNALMKFVDGHEKNEPVATEMPPSPRPATARPKEVFKGEAKLEEITMDAMLTLDPNTGMLMGIQVLQPGENQPVRKNQLRVAMGANEFARETMRMRWSKDESLRRKLKEEIAATILRTGRITEGDVSKPASKLSRNQVSAAEAWANPAQDNGLLEKFEKLRQKIAAERKAQLKKRKKSS